VLHRHLSVRGKGRRTGAFPVILPGLRHGMAAAFTKISRLEFACLRLLELLLFI
jgi:hypothetical protein